MVILVGNKTDLISTDKPRIPEADIQEFIKTISYSEFYQLHYVECSAKKRENMQLIVNKIMEVCLDKTALRMICYNCFELRDDLKLHSGFLSCSDCFTTFDKEKAESFARLDNSKLN